MSFRQSTLLAAPHRLPFLTGALNLIVLMFWWCLTLIDLHIRSLGLAPSELPTSLLHAPIMLYLLLPPFFFGFLLTVFPRWMGYADLVVRQYAPIGIAFLIASALAWIGLFASALPILIAAFVLAALGWIVTLWQLFALIRAERRDGKGPTWHAWSVFAALVLGLGGLVLLLLFLIGHDSRLVQAANLIGTFGLLVPVFTTVAHRMIPFFAGNVIKGYVHWRPFWVLLALWILLITHLALELFGLKNWLWVSALGLAGLTGLMLRRWWPSASAPGLLRVLLWGFAWAPVGFALIAGDSGARIAGLNVSLGRAPVHALYIGMAGSMLIAMVTRVTQGHAGRPLEMPWVAWIAFCGIQLSAVARVIAGMREEQGNWLVLAALVWLLSVLPWVFRQVHIYVAPRIDGKPG
ncbi:NnrS family protein [Aquisediminimonas profunda]|uniref:NnrS family protein n=1 Tax=Aquisediminimonas profunda TaxID=1550733 RepID=UPI001C6395F3|nr:NnrS family protein [Aquisediminimonas profunda]